MSRLIHRRSADAHFSQSSNSVRGLLLEAMVIEFVNASVATGIAYVLDQDWLKIFAALQVGLFVTAYRLLAAYRGSSIEVTTHECEPNSKPLQAIECRDLQKIEHDTH